MGVLFEICCPHCGYKRNLNLGQGVMDHKLEKVLPLFSRELQERIKKALQDMSDEYFWVMERKLGYCRECGVYEAVPVFRILYGDRELRFGEKCVCGSDYDILTMDETELAKEIAECVCQNCKGRLEGKIVGNWD